VRHQSGTVSVDWRSKGFPTDESVAVGPECGWNLLAGDLPLPVLVLKEQAVEHNIATMHAFCASRGASIAPHVKTTMSPELVRRQIDAGAWGVTVATTSQARIVRAFGCTRILIANEVVDAAGLHFLSQLLADPDVEVFTLVDSPKAVELLDAELLRARTLRPASVLLEVGMLHGRSGCRDRDQVARTLDAIDGASHVELVGVEAYEGVIHAEGDVLGEVESFLDGVLHLAMEIDRQGRFATDEIILTAGGSAFPDRVIDVFGRWHGNAQARIVVRSGCYITHDHGYYSTSSPFGTRTGADPLIPALEIWGSVVSRPEAELAIVNFGKRDVSYDLGLPVPLWTKSRDGSELESARHLRIVDLNDQHAYVAMQPFTRLEPGDMLGAGLSHPCTVFDKWRTIPVVDQDYTVVAAISTYF
jgi:D-serine dehydratase